MSLGQVNSRMLGNFYTAPQFANYSSANYLRRQAITSTARQAYFRASYPA
jgi:hypothetical protein